MAAIAKKDLRKVEHWFTKTMFNPLKEVNMILAQEQAILKGQTQFEQIAVAAGDCFASVAIRSCFVDTISALQCIRRSS